MAFERVDQEECVGVDWNVRFFSVRRVTSHFVGLNKWGARWRLCFCQRPISVIEFEPGMQTYDGRVWFGVCWQSVQLEASGGVLYTLE
ncbi:hypothetical protein GCM10009647_071750 [Streptomyces sanglieri]